MHVGVAVHDLTAASNSMERLFGYRVVSGPFDDPIQRVSVSFLMQATEDAAQIEFVAPLTSDSPVNSMLSRRAGGAYHLCFETNDIDMALTHAKNQGCVVLSQPQPAIAFAGRRIAWFYTPDRQLFELVEQAGPQGPGASRT